jgi:two-component system response regulator DegU
MRLVALGLRNAEIARKLFISEQTVKSHLSNIFQKLEIQDRVELTVYAIRNGIIGVHERV